MNNSLLSLPYDMLREILINAVDYRSVVLVSISINNMKRLCKTIKEILDNDNLFWGEVMKEMGLKKRTGSSIPPQMDDLFGVVRYDKVPSWKLFYASQEGGENVITNSSGTEIYRGEGTVLYSEDLLLIKEDTRFLRLSSQGEIIPLKILGENPFLYDCTLIELISTIIGPVIMLCDRTHDWRERYCIYKLNISGIFVSFSLLSYYLNLSPMVTYNGIYIENYYGIEGIHFVYLAGGIGRRYLSSSFHFNVIDTHTKNVEVIHYDRKLRVYLDHELLYTKDTYSSEYKVYLKKFLCNSDTVYDLYTGKILLTLDYEDASIERIIEHEDMYLILLV